MKKIIIIGAGDGGRIVSRLIEDQADFAIAGFIDDEISLQGKSINKYKVVGTSKDLGDFKDAGFVVALGNNMKARKVLFNKAVAAGLKPASLISRTAVIDKSAKIGPGAIILANCVVGPFSLIGKNSFIYTGTIIEHDSQIGDNVFFAPGVALAGHVRVGDDTFWGINSCAVANVTIGAHVIVGAGAVVLRDIADNTVAAGVPAKPLREND
jgi:sugar O-acyltransferase (sialic acid O-acetyltransferase NeuD family)